MSPPTRSSLRTRSGLRLGVSVAFLVPVLVTALVSLQAFHRDGAARRLMVEETYRGVAELLSARLDEHIATHAAELTAELGAGGWEPAELIPRLYAAEQRGEAPRPLLLFGESGTTRYPPFCDCQGLDEHSWAQTDPDNETFLAGMEQARVAELGGHLAAAIDHYRASFEVTERAAAQAAALAGVARNQLEAGRPAEALRTWRRLVAEWKPYEPGVALWLTRAHRGIFLSLRQLGDETAKAAGLDYYRFLVRHRLHLPEGSFQRYLDEIDGLLAEAPLSVAERQALETLQRRAAQRESIASLVLLMNNTSQLLRDAILTVESEPASRPEIAVPSFLATAESKNGSVIVVSETGESPWVAARFDADDAERALLEVLATPGPWSEAGIALVDASGEVAFASSGDVRSSQEMVIAGAPLARFPGWRLAAYPTTASFTELARREAGRYGLILAFALAAVAAALVMAAGSVRRELALARMREDFVASVSHELKTPLALVRMYAENLLHGWVGEEKRQDYYRIMVGESERLSGLIDNVLEFRRTESGDRVYRLEPLELKDLVGEITRRYGEHFALVGTELMTRLCSFPVRVEADREALGRVLVNLLSNAAKYIGDGERRIDVELTTDARQAFLTVADTGIGMRRAEMARIFEPFYRGTSEAVRAVGGSGIGLALVRRIVTAHGGAIEVESTPGRGSRFTLRLPLMAAAAPAPELRPASEEAAA